MYVAERLILCQIGLLTVSLRTFYALSTNRNIALLRHKEYDESLIEMRIWNQRTEEICNHKLTATVSGDGGIVSRKKILVCTT
jgi:hypothetical protein